MRANAPLTAIIMCIGVLSACKSNPPSSNALPYRGAYTFGSAVETFCPETNSQCFWLASDTPPNVRSELRKLSNVSAKPYEPICVVIEGELDRDTPRQGFAANYDGLITITGLLGRCELPNRVTPSQLQHHHWVLARIDGAELEIKDADSLPDLAIGKQMQVSGNSGCNNFRGAASLAGHQFKIEQMASTQRLCTPARNEIERTVTAVLSSASSASLDANRNLTLANGEHDLHSTLAD
jgi:heat shock protein HslJ